MQTLIEKQIFISGSELVRKAIFDLLINHSSYSLLKNKLFGMMKFRHMSTLI